MQIVAHRGFSSRQPEMTRASYTEAIDWAAETGTPLALECDVQLSADGQIICLHDLTIDRTSNQTGRARDRSLAELKAIDFGSWKVLDPTPEQRELVTLRELMTMVQQARRAKTRVGLVIETKHPGGQGRKLEEAVAPLVTEFGWDRPDSPVRLISFSVKAVKRFGSLLPALERTLLVEKDLKPWRKGKLPDGVKVVGLDLLLLKADPSFAKRVRKRGNKLHVWTANSYDDIALCHHLGVASITTDYPERVVEVLKRTKPG